MVSELAEQLRAEGRQRRRIDRVSKPLAGIFSEEFRIETQKMRIELGNKNKSNAAAIFLNWGIFEHGRGGEQAMRDVFQQLDYRSVGSVSYDAVASALAFLDPTLDMEKAEAVFAVEDWDHSGMIDFEEFFSIIKKLLPQSLPGLVSKEPKEPSSPTADVKTEPEEGDSEDEAEVEGAGTRVRTLHRYIQRYCPCLFRGAMDNYDHLAAMAERFTTNRWFERLTVTCIVSVIVPTCLSLHYDEEYPSKQMRRGVEIFSKLLLGVFTAEFGLKVVACGRRPLNFLFCDDGVFNALDASVVLLSYALMGSGSVEVASPTAAQPGNTRSFIR